jgi:hypothetical protein
LSKSCSLEPGMDIYTITYTTGKVGLVWWWKPRWWEAILISSISSLLVHQIRGGVPGEPGSEEDPAQATTSGKQSIEAPGVGSGIGVVMLWIQNARSGRFGSRVYHLMMWYPPAYRVYHLMLWYPPPVMGEIYKQMQQKYEKSCFYNVILLFYDIFYLSKN